MNLIRFPISGCLFGLLEDTTVKDGPPEESSSVYESRENMMSHNAGRFEGFHVEHSSSVEWEKLCVRNALQAGKFGEGDLLLQVRP